jgi:hypothetical protein
VKRCDSNWHKSSHSESGTCVEVAQCGDHVHVRDSKDQRGPQLRFTASEWAAFVEGVKHREFETEVDC